MAKSVVTSDGNLIDIDGRDGHRSCFAFTRPRKSNSSRIPYCFPLHRGYAFSMPLTIELTPESRECLMRQCCVSNGDRSLSACSKGHTERA